MKPILAIDFGTTNTYISYSLENGEIQELKITVGGNYDTHGITSAILYRDAGAKKGKTEIGQDAINTYSCASADKIQKNGLRFAANFKPDIENSEDAKENTENFLKIVFQNISNTNAIKDFKNKISEMDVIFGIPCEASRVFQKNLKLFAKHAGFGDIRLMEEPFGALCHFLTEYTGKVNNSRSLPLEQYLEKTILVIDFGGGTCDFALLKGGKIQNYWGSMSLGGRLFDDLFYQWICDVATRKSDIAGKEFWYLTTVAREIKENFSNKMHKDRNSIFNMYIQGICDCEIRWEEFVKRSQNYTPSPICLKSFFQDKQCKIPHDLLNWFQDYLIKGFEEYEIDFSTVDLILLAGGSSCWDFVLDFCKEKFGEEKLQRCNDVFAAISKGLGEYVLLKEKVSARLQNIENEQEAHISEFLKNANQILLPEKDENNMVWKKQSEKIHQFGQQFFQVVIQPELENFKKKGGKILDLEESIKKRTNECEYIIQNNLQELFRQKNEEINRLLQEELVSWLKFQPEKLQIDTNAIQLESFYNSDESMKSGIGDDVGLFITGAITTILIAIIAISATIGGPFAWAAAAAISLTSAATIPGYIKNTEWSAFCANWILWKNQIKSIGNNKFLPKFQEFFEKLYTDIIQNNKGKFEVYLTEIVSKEIEKCKKIIELEK